MARLMQAADALNRARGVNQGLDAVVSMLMSTEETPDSKSIAEVIWALHDQMQLFLDEVGRAIDN